LTTVDPPELLSFIKKEYPGIQVHRPVLSMWQLIVKKRMPPTRIARYCCEYLKEGGSDRSREEGRIIATGIRWEESVRRGKRRMVEQCRNQPGKNFLHPIIDWTSVDIWDYIRRENVPVCSLYAEGWKRIGCILCPMATLEGKKRDMERWPKYAENYKLAFKRMIAARAEAGLGPFLNDKMGGRGATPEEIFDWWVSGCAATEEDPTPWLFE
jgi:phosphoadenosine phosphosulfate reductase